MEADAFDMPLRRTDLADPFGPTSVHVNRSLRALRGEGLVVLERRRLTILDVLRRQAFCAFDPSYLHLEPCSAVVPHAAKPAT